MNEIKVRKVKTKYKLKFLQAIARMLKDVPNRVPVGTKISRINVIKECGFTSGVINTLNRSYPEICLKIAQARKIQKTTDNAYTRNRVKEYSEALDRLCNDRPIRVPKGSLINQKTVALEAGRSSYRVLNDLNFYTDLNIKIMRARSDQIRASRIKK